MSVRDLGSMMSYGRRVEGIPDPFTDISQLFLPDNWRDLMRLCQQLYMTMGAYRKAVERVHAYFLTEPEIDGASSDDKKDEYEKQCEEELSVIGLLRAVLDDGACYGNAIRATLPVFERWLASPSGGLYRFEDVYYGREFQFQFTADYQFTAIDQRDGRRRAFRVVDCELGEHVPLRLWKLNPFDVEIECDTEYSGEKRYNWIVPESYKQKLKHGNFLTLKNIHKTILEALRKKCRRYELHPGSVFHYAVPAPAGAEAELRGWGCPPIIFHMRALAHAQSYRRFNEAAAQDHLFPMRVITPAAQSMHSNSLAHTSGLFGQQDGADVLRMLRWMAQTHQKDPHAYYAMPFAVDMNMMGLDGTAMATPQLLEAADMALMNDIGIPVDLYNGSLQLQATPVAMRLMESVFRHIPEECDRFMRWIARFLNRSHAWEAVSLKLKKPRIANDIQLLMLKFQMMLSGHMSQTDFMAELNINPKRQRRLIATETREAAEVQMELQKELEASGLADMFQNGVPITPGGQGVMDPTGGAGGGGGGAAPAGGEGQGGPLGAGAGLMTSPVDQAIQQYAGRQDVALTDIESVAAQIAPWLDQQPENIKDSELRKLKAQLPFVHDRVQALREETKRQLQQQAVAGGQPAPGGAPPAGQPMPQKVASRPLPMRGYQGRRLMGQFQP